MTTQLLERPATVTVPDAEAGRLILPTTGGSSTIPTYRIGTPDIQCRYPVIIGEDQVIGRAYRWHRDWLVLTTAGEHNLRRPPKGTPGTDMAAAHLAEAYAAGHIGAVPLEQVLAEAPTPLVGPVPLLHPRMPVNDRNTEGAEIAFAGLAAHFWRAVLTGFPGSDNHWYLHCELCGWEGLKFWSHLRGRNGEPPSARRHKGGCIGEDKVRQLIPAYH
ncbi:hypothetical protein [Streptomyces olivaceus]|uniref:hypothetical protein n=1 Tax=Streptomyces olivaceus TaxID=47716 RepID=UPI0036EA495F